MSLGQRLRVILVRHGETEWALAGRHTGRTDIGLTARGEDEARGLAAELGRLRFDHVWSSPAQRARATCELAGLGETAELVPDLAEWAYGDYEGRMNADIWRERPGWLVYRDGCPGGEMPDEVSARADRIIARLETLGGTIALFSHGHFGCSLAARWIGLPVLHAQHFVLGTASISQLQTSPRDPSVRAIGRWNTGGPLA